MICRWCGKEVFPGQRNCGSCGREVPPLSDCGGFYQVVPDAAQQKKDSYFQQPPKQMLQPPEHGRSGGGEKKWVLLFPVVGMVVLSLVLFAILNGRISKIAQQIEALQDALSDQTETSETGALTEMETVATTEVDESAETTYTSTIETQESEMLPTGASVEPSEAEQEREF